MLRCGGIKKVRNLLDQDRRRIFPFINREKKQVRHDTKAWRAFPHGGHRELTAFAPQDRRRGKFLNSTLRKIAPCPSGANEADFPRAGTDERASGFLAAYGQALLTFHGWAAKRKSKYRNPVPLARKLRGIGADCNPNPDRPSLAGLSLPAYSGTSLVEVGDILGARFSAFSMKSDV